MVFSLFDSFFELFANYRTKLYGNKLVDYYTREGFNKEEAKGLAWLCNHKSIGHSTGFFIGLGFVFFQDARIKKFTFK